MATKQELHQARKAVYDAGVSLRAQGEILRHVGWFTINPPYDKSDLELAFLKQLPSIWKNGTFDNTELKKIISNTTYLDDVLNRAKPLPKEDNLGTYILNYRDEEAIATETELNQLKPIAKHYEELWTYWKNSLKNDLDNTPFHPDGLKKVKERLNQLTKDLGERDQTIKGQQKIIDENKDLPEQIKALNKQLGDKDEELKKRNDTIDALKREKQSSDTEKLTNLATQLKTRDEIISERNGTISVLNDELRKRNKTINERQKSISELNTENEKLTTEKSSLEAQLKTQNDIISERNKTLGELNDELKKHNNTIDERQKTINELNAENEKLNTGKSNLEAQVKQLTEKVLKIEREEVKQELTSFYQSVDIDDDLIEEKFKSNEEWKKKYGENFDYEDVVDKGLTLENKKDMVGAFKVVACICATEEVRKLKDAYKNTTPKPTRFLKKIEKVNKGWKEAEKYLQINKENNPFYLSIIEEKKQEYKNEIETLMKENQLQSSQLQSNK